MVLTCLVVGLSTAFADSYQVTFATQDCNGDSGFATVGVDQIYKVESAGCQAADGTPLKQLLVHNGQGSYNVYTITEKESENIMNEIKSYMGARRGVLDRSDAIIVKP